MTTTNYKSKRAKLEQYHKELQLREQAERKDKVVLCSFVISGLIGVFALVFMGLPNQGPENLPAKVEVSEQPHLRKATLN